MRMVGIGTEIAGLGQLAAARTPDGERGQIFPALWAAARHGGDTGMAARARRDSTVERRPFQFHGSISRRVSTLSARDSGNVFSQLARVLMKHASQVL
jgi:hypothetical protein